MAERRSDALRSNCTVAMIRATVIGLTTNRTSRFSGKVGVCLRQLVEMCKPGNMAHRLLPLLLPRSLDLPINASGSDPGPTFRSIYRCHCFQYPRMKQDGTQHNRAVVLKSNLLVMRVRKSICCSRPCGERRKKSTTELRQKLCGFQSSEYFFFEKF